MRNITGTPVEGDDFFDRPRELARFERELDNAANILLSAPRRTGKTSLIIRLCERCRKKGWKAVFFDVEGCFDELVLAEKLLDGLNEQGLNPQWLERTRLGILGIRKSLGGLKVGAGIDLEISGSDSPEHGTLARTLESVFKRIQSEGIRLLIAIDELPELLLALHKQEQGPQRVERLLHWLRSVRQTYRGKIQWVFLGSIGLDSFVDQRNLRKTINDLVGMGLDALTLEEADHFLEKLGRDNGLPIEADARKWIIEKVGWPLPYHLNLMFHALRETGVTSVDQAAIDAAITDLGGQSHFSYFDTWFQRLHEQFDEEGATDCKTILKYLCQHPRGKSRNLILGQLVAQRPEADPSKLEDSLAGLLQILQRDGYLIERKGKYAFRSFLLRQYWYNREIV